MTSFAVVTPSRGLVHSRTIWAVEANRRAAVAAGHEDRGWFGTDALPIPDCDEFVAESGMATGADALWFVEEDVIPPLDALVGSFGVLSEGFAVAAVDYPVGNPSDEWGCLVRDRAGEILWCGLGATLVKREVFETLPKPWYSTDVTYLAHGNGVWEPRRQGQPNEKRYGQQDIYFCMNLREAGFRIGQVPGMTAAHANWPDRLGERGSNVGWHTISVRTVIKRSWPG